MRLICWPVWMRLSPNRLKQVIHLDRSPWIVNGFVIGFSISLFVCFGVIFLLSMIKKLKFPEHEVLVLTVLFYGIIFFIAHSGVRADTRRNRALISRNSIKNFSKAPAETKSTKARVKTILWNMITIISVAWVTPALIIYWISPRHPHMAYAACCFLFSLAGATAYLLKTGKQNQTVYNRIIFFTGVCLGVLSVIHFFPDL